MSVNPIPPTGDWSWHEVTYRLRCRGWTFKTLGDANGVHPSAFSRLRRVADGRHQATLARAIGLSPLAMWPSRYEPETGRPLTHSEWESATNSREPSCTTEQSPAAVVSSS